MKKFLFSIFSTMLIFSLVLTAQSGAMDVEAAKLYNKGNKEVKSGNYAGAIKSYEEALKISKDYRIFYQLGTAYKKQRKYANAESALNESLKLNPEFATAYNSLGTTYYAWGKYDKAVESFQKFHDNVSSKKMKKVAAKYIGLAYTKLGESKFKDRDYTAAEDYFKNAVKYYKYDAAYLKLADIYVETGKFNEAIKAADNAINNRSSKSKVPKGAPYFFKGMAFKGLKNVEKAKENFKIAKTDRTYRDRSKYELKYMN
ncbi:MAG: hypothetical protein CR986_04485 [Ignavibacteriae bacterium]|nr:MAG: hypothetical protein CR986_04485 [Ignavibacteriota bacterium]